MLTWLENCVITSLTGAGTFAITYTKLYIPVVTLSTKNNRKLLKQLDSGFKWKINLNKYQSKISRQADNECFLCLVPQSFQGVNILFVLSYENVQKEQYKHNVISQKWK